MKYLSVFVPLVVIGACSADAPIGRSAGLISPSAVTVSHNEDAAVVAPTVHITDGGFFPAELTVANGSKLLFINDSSATRWPRSDPHDPDGHNTCLEFEAVGRLLPGQQRSTGVLTHEECGFHDHLGGDDPFEGQVTVQGLSAKTQ